MPILVRFQEVGLTTPTVFRNELLLRLSGAKVDIATDEYLVLWDTESEPYQSVLTGVIAQLSRKGAKRVAIHHGPYMDHILDGKSGAMLQAYGLSLAKKLVTGFDGMTIRLSFSRGDTRLPKLLRDSVQQVRAAMAEA